MLHNVGWFLMTNQQFSLHITHRGDKSAECLLCFLCDLELLPPPPPPSISSPVCCLSCLLLLLWERFFLPCFLRGGEEAADLEGLSSAEELSSSSAWDDGFTKCHGYLFNINTIGTSYWKTKCSQQFGPSPFLSPSFNQCTPYGLGDRTKLHWFCIHYAN